MTLWANGRNILEELLKEFEAYFAARNSIISLTVKPSFTRTQRPTEKMREKPAKYVPNLEEDLLRQIILRGLLPPTKAFILQHHNEMKTIGDIMEVAKVAQIARMLSTPSTQWDLYAVMEVINASRQEVRQQANRIDRMSTNVINNSNRSPSPRRVTYADEPPEAPSPTYRHGTPRFGRRRRPQRGTVMPRVAIQ